MARKTAGYRYPHATTAARQHDHSMCAVAETIAARAEAGAEEWGTPHRLPPVGDPAEAHRIRNRLFAAKQCKRVQKAHGMLSIAVHYLTDGEELTNTRTATGRGHILVIRVWPIAHGRARITERVEAGEQLDYNPWKERP